MFKEPNKTIMNFHCHIYFTEETVEKVETVYTALAKHLMLVCFKPAFNRKVYTVPVGPHPLPMMQIIFEPGLFGEIVQWLMLNRNGFTVLIHPVTGEDLLDHTERPIWLGEKLPLDITKL